MQQITACLLHVSPEKPEPYPRTVHGCTISAISLMAAEALLGGSSEAGCNDRTNHDGSCHRCVEPFIIATRTMVYICRLLNEHHQVGQSTAQLRIRKLPIRTIATTYS